MMTSKKRYRVLPYKQASQSAKALSSALGGKRIKLENSEYVPKSQDVIVNWGNSQAGIDCNQLLNHGAIVANASNKLTFFRTMEGADWLPPFWTNQEDIKDEDFPVVARTVLSGHSGVGIVVCESRSDLVPAPLYVKYINKKEEYRVHVGKYINGDYEESVTTIALQQKKRRLDHEEPNWKIRNHANGFIYAREDVNPPASVLECAADCLLRSGLDFGAVDVIWNEHYQKAYVLEINTAPGLEGQTVDDYVKFFKGYVNSS